MDPNVYEKLGAFYLGRRYELDAGEAADEPLLYDAKDLVTHAVCVGMTGSGKTGLCVTLLEEAAIDGVPALIIDPKGDLGNLLLTFPKLDSASFRPWVSEDDARRKGVDADAYARQQADLWRNGLASWGQDGERIARLREAVDIAIYTPGSDAGLPISILSSFQAPSEAVWDDGDALRERIATAATSLLGLLGIDADPIQSREHILLSKLFDQAWRAGRDLDLPDLIRAIQDPPIEKVGIMPLESFYPAKERFGLAMALNNLLASPGFQAWMEGTPLDVDKLLYTDTGKPRIAILSIAHLSDAERMFFVTLVLNQALSWMRSRPGTSSLRAILYMDEVFGYLPPVAEPPSKRPLLTMLKQARAFGLGLVLATQNPVDLDYKALSNIGTWFLGRLQTERDKARVLDGLESSKAGGFDRAELERILSGLGSRVFLLHNVHEDAPEVFQVRWAMSYLRGPLTRGQIKTLMAGRAGQEPSPAEEAAAPDAAPTAGRSSAAAEASAAPDAGQKRPMLPPEVEERFLPLSGPLTGRPGADLVYRPGVVATARVHCVDSRRGLEAEEMVMLFAHVAGSDRTPDWYEAVEVDLDVERLETEAASPEASYLDLADALADAKAYRAFEKSFADTLYRTRRHPLFKSSTTGLISRPGESERDFRIRLAETLREERDAAVDKMRKRYATRLRTVEDRIRRAEQRVEKEAAQAKDQKWQAAVSIGSTVLGALFGRKRSLTTASRSIGRTMKEGKDVERAEEELEAQRLRQADLEAELRGEIDALEARFDPHSEALDSFDLKPRRTDIDVRLVALAWAPHRELGGGMIEPAWG